MALVVFLRGVNVGGHKKLQPSVLARDLEHLDVVNVGAAGTFVVRSKVSQSALRQEVLRRLAFEAELMICPGRELIELGSAQIFRDPSSDRNTTHYVSILAKRPRMLPELPVCRPTDDNWQVKIVAIIGRFALSLHRRQGRRLIYPNEVVETHFDVPATTRNWSTISAICGILEGGQDE